MSGRQEESHGRQDSCPYCGAALGEKIRWWQWILLAGVLAVGLIARRFLEPLISWPMLIGILALAAIHHLLWALRRRRRNRSS